MLLQNELNLMEEYLTMKITYKYRIHGSSGNREIVLNYFKEVFLNT